MKKQTELRLQTIWEAYLPPGEYSIWIASKDGRGYSYDGIVVTPGSGMLEIRQARPVEKQVDASEELGICEHAKVCRNKVCGHRKAHKMNRVCHIGYCAKWEDCGGTAKCIAVEEELVVVPSNRLIELEVEDGV